MQKEIKEYGGEIYILDEMNKGVKVKTRKARKFYRQNKIFQDDT